MEHPLIPNLSDQTLEQLQDKITELTKKLGIAMRSGNAHLCGQLRMAIESYRSAYQAKLNDQKGKDYDFSGKIDIS